MRPFKFEENLSYLRAPRTALVGQTLFHDWCFPCSFYKAHVLHLKSTFVCTFVLTAEETEKLAHILHNQFSAFSSSD